MTWILFLWLAYSPDSLTPLERYDTKGQCLAALKADVQASLKPATNVGGATYVCLDEGDHQT